MPITLLCIHGNHERRPTAGLGYERARRFGGEVMVQPEFPNQLFALDGEVYELDGQSCIAIGGAYSIDKEYRLMRGGGWQADIVLSHTTPLSLEPREAFLPFIDQRTVDTSTEEWLDSIERRLDYKRWYAGRFHTVKETGKLRLMYQDYAKLGE